jgi:2-desacetyl-2-hydroxyethyl bacteriochlorophyllide A dehydrogenase
MRMKALVKVAAGPGGLELQDLSTPVPEPGQVLLAVRAAALCGTDVHIAHGRMPVRPPLVLGHELAGVVATVGPGTIGVAVGQRVTTETDASFCGRCAHCLSGNQHLCPSRTAIGTTAPGGLAEFVVVPAAGIHPLPAGVDFVTGALTEPLAVAVRAVVERGAIEPGEEVVVIGPGTIGLLVAQVALARGATVTVAGLSRHAARFALARELGVRRTAALDAAQDWDAIARGRDDLGVDVVIECSGAPDALASGLHLLRKGGRLIMVAFTPGQTAPLDLDHVVQRELTIVAARGKRPSCFEIALDLLDRGDVKLGPLISHRFQLEQWAEAFETASGSGTKVVIEIGEG